MNRGLNEYRKMIHSQWGEDGILEEIFRRIGEKHRFCVEFGAGEGYTYSNVWHLLKDRSWKALLIEASDEDFRTWIDLTRGMKGVEILKRFITIDGETSLEKTLAEYKVPNDLDLLSIDIDSDDHHILKSLQKYRPRVLIIEHNPTIPPFDTAVQEPGAERGFGSSAKANAELARTKGYALVAATHTNCIFVNRDEFPKLGIEEPDLSEVFDWQGLTYVISAYNGTLYLRNPHKGGQPSYSWAYESLNINLWKKIFHSITIGLSLNRPYSATLAARYQPAKILRDNPGNSGGILYACKKALSFFRGMRADRK